MIIDLNIDANFWEMNKQFKIPREFNKLYSSDNSKGKEKSSKIMWAIMLCIPHEDSFVREKHIDERKMIVARDYLKDENFDWNQVQPIFDELKDFVLTEAEKTLETVKKKLKERRDFLDSVQFEFDSFDTQTGKTEKGTIDQIEKMLLGTQKIYDLVSTLEKQANEERSQRKNSKPQSLTDSGEI